MISDSDLEMIENLCKFMIRWAEREPDSVIPDVLADDIKEEIKGFKND